MRDLAKLGYNSLDGLFENRKHSLQDFKKNHKISTTSFSTHHAREREEDEKREEHQNARTRRTKIKKCWGLNIDILKATCSI